MVYYIYVNRAILLDQQLGPEISSMTVCGSVSVPSRQALPAPSVITFDGMASTGPSRVACATFKNKTDVALLH